METPWHSDESYWLDLPDKRALSFWFPMQDVNVSQNRVFQNNARKFKPALTRQF